MNIIEQLTNELILSGNAYNAGEIDKETMNLHLSLVMKQLELVEINYDKQPLSFLKINNQNVVFNNLLRKHRNKAFVAIRELKRSDSKRKFNAIMRSLVSEQLYFKSLHDKIQRSCVAYKERNKLIHNEKFQIFIMKETKENE